MSSSNDRRGNWMQTFSGGVFYPIDPRADEVFIDDIAHGLSNMCRFAGQCDNFYSVAEHSVLVSHVVPEADAFAALMHDAPEAYIMDIPRPLKGYLDNYAEIEAGVWQAICEKYNLTVELPKSVKIADNSVLLAEQAQIMKPSPQPWNVTGIAAPVEIQCWRPKLAEGIFLARFHELTQGRYND